MATRRHSRRPAGASHIRVVSDDERAPAPAHNDPEPSPSDGAAQSPEAATAPPDGQMSLADAVAGGDYQQILQAQARDIIRDLAAATGASKAALHGRLMTISKEIESLKAAPGGEKSVVATTDDEPWDSTAL